MPNLPRGYQAAYENWQVNTRRNSIYALGIPAIADDAFAASVTATLEALERYRIHMEERARHTNNPYDANFYMGRAGEIANAKTWVTDNITCGDESHVGCQKADEQTTL